MAYPSGMPGDAKSQGGARLGGLGWLSTTFAARFYVWRAVLRTTAPTDGDPAAYGGVATHADGDNASVADLNPAGVPLVVVGGKSTEGTPKARAIKVSSDGTVQVSGSVTSGVPTAGSVTAMTVGTSESSFATAANCREVRLYNASASATIYYRFATGVTTSNGYPIPPGAQDEIPIGPSVTIYLISSAAGTDVRRREMTG